MQRCVNPWEGGARLWLMQREAIQGGEILYSNRLDSRSCRCRGSIHFCPPLYNMHAAHARVLVTSECVGGALGHQPCPARVASALGFGNSSHSRAMKTPNSKWRIWTPWRSRHRSVRQGAQSNPQTSIHAFIRRCAWPLGERLPMGPRSEAKHVDDDRRAERTQNTILGQSRLCNS